MLIVEYLSNGQRRVRLHKDWNPTRISKAYTPPMQDNMKSRDAVRIQTAYIGKGLGK